MNATLHRLTLLATLTTLAATAGCTRSAVDVTNLGPAPLLTGSWVQDGAVIGSSFVLTLSQSSLRDTLVTGTGTYSIEAGRSGTLTVTGGATDTRVTLEIVYDYGPVAHFDGAPATASVLSGAMKNGPKESLMPSYLVTFHRKN